MTEHWTRRGAAAGGCVASHGGKHDLGRKHNSSSIIGDGWIPKVERMRWDIHNISVTIVLSARGSAGHHDSIPSAGSGGFPFFASKVAIHLCETGRSRKRDSGARHILRGAQELREILGCETHFLPIARASELHDSNRGKNRNNGGDNKKLEHGEAEFRSWKLEVGGWSGVNR